MEIFNKNMAGVMSSPVAHKVILNIFEEDVFHMCALCHAHGMPLVYHVVIFSYTLDQEISFKVL